LGKESQMKQMDLIHLNINDDTAAVPAEDKSKPKAGSFKKVILETELQAGYGNIGPYLDDIQSLPIFMQVEKVDIRRKEESFPKLQVNVQQVLFMASSPKKEAQGQGNGQPIQTLR
jgi:hypothetical protein